MDNPVPRVMEPIRVGPVKEQRGREGTNQNPIKQNPLPIVTGITFKHSLSVKRACILFLLSDQIDSNTLACCSFYSVSSSSFFQAARQQTWALR